VSAGHSDAEPRDLAAAVEAGLRMATHLFNAMSGIRARRPGLAAAALADDRVACGLIADGHHVAPEVVRVALRSKPPRRLFLVSDATPPVGGRSATFRIGGVEITARDGRCESPDGILAGSAASLPECVEWLVGRDLARPTATTNAETP
jgi:N-acetylglucosamine-6-phosphate deacetylase